MLLRNLYKGRYIIKDMLIKDLKARYVGSLLGPLWNVLSPLFYIVLYTLVFSTILNVKFARSGDTSSFVVYFLSGFIPWLFFLDSVTRGTTVFLSNAHIIKKVEFPLEVCVITILLSSMVTFFIYMVLYSLYLMITGDFKLISLPLMLFPFFIQVLLILGISFGLGSIAVFFRDLTPLVPLLLTAFFFLTPIVYPADIIPESLRGYFALNPFYWITEIYRGIIIEGKLPGLHYFFYPLVLSIFVFYLGFFVFQRTKSAFKDIL